MDYPAQAFYIPGAETIEDFAIEVDGKTVGQYSRESLAELQLKHPSIQLMNSQEAFELAYKASLDAYVHPPVEITEQHYWEMFEILPPIKHRIVNGAESFMISEALTYNVRSIFCQIGDRYFKMCDVDTLTREQIMEKCKKLIENPELSRLNHLILVDKVEFPDALFKVTDEFNLTDDERVSLEELYDQQ
jgi:hypothetical protein